VTRGQLPQRAGLLGLNGGGTAAAVAPNQNDSDHCIALSEQFSPENQIPISKRYFTYNP